MRDNYKQLFVILGLAAAVLAVFWQVRGFEFLAYDDNKYVSANGYILSGVRLQNIAWVFTSEHCDNWHPLTGLSHMLDCQLFGPNPGQHHLVNLMFHIVNTVLIFTVFRRLTGAFWQSAFVAACFGLHPLHVESVAWVSERKDVLSTMFWLLTMAAYLHYVKKPKVSRYMLTLALFAMGLMSKPMVVTLPFVLLLLDYWPLNRLGVKNKEQIFRLVWEKIPFFVFSAISCIITIVIQSRTGALKNIELFSLSARVANAIVSCSRYIVKMVWPTNLAVFYPHPGKNIAYWQIAGAVVLLAGITFWVVRESARHKYLLTGWFWYLGTLVPVIGLVQAGIQSMADRYTYIPSIGLFIIGAWGAGDLLSKWRYKQTIFWFASLTVILVLAILTWFQVSYWRDTMSLFDHALKVTSGNDVAYNNRGTIYYERDEYDLAIADYDNAIEINPRYADAYYNRGNAYVGKGQYGRAISEYNKALAIKPLDAETYNSRGTAWYGKGRTNRAIADFDKAIKIDPEYTEAYFRKAIACESTGQKKEAIEAYKAFVKYAIAQQGPLVEQVRRRIQKLEQ